MVRIGNGYDVHEFVEGKKLMLGGVEIPFEFGLRGHSDADSLLHALCDALLGAAALGDIGKLFPDTDPKYKNIESSKLLWEVVLLLNQNNYSIGNIDTIIVADKPMVAQYVPEMRRRIAEICGVAEENVSVKATTEEGLGLAGRGIAANAVCVIYDSQKDIFT